MITVSSDNFNSSNLASKVPTLSSTWKPGASIRDGDWKLIKFYDYEKVELYNLKDDPSESKDLSKENPKIAKDLESKLVAWQKRMKAKLPRPNPDYKN